MKKTTTITLHPIAKALDLANQFIPKSKFNPFEDEDRKQFFKHYTNLVKDLDSFSNEEMKGLASRDAEELNSFLKSNEFDIVIDKLGDNEFGSVGVLKAAVAWLTKGTRFVKTLDGKSYNFARLGDQKTFSVFNTFHNHPVARITTTDGDQVFICEAGKSLAGFDLLNCVMKIQDAVSEDTEMSSYKSMSFPCMKIEDRPNIGWLKGLQLSVDKIKESYVLTKAEQQTKFEMDESGAKVESAAAVVATRSVSISKHLEIADTAYVWIVRKGCKVPYFAAQVEKDAWIEK